MILSAVRCSLSHDTGLTELFRRMPDCSKYCRASLDCLNLFLRMQHTTPRTRMTLHIFYRDPMMLEDTTSHFFHGVSMTPWLPSSRRWLEKRDAGSAIVVQEPRS